ncbi:MAG: hypothetical protein IJ640_01420 [Prevotella sp.]|nr:hypothetical protein [Prevotella sp.]
MGTRHTTQLEVIRNYMMDGKTITPIEALNLCGCFRLSAVIHTLRHKENIPIHMDQPQASDGKPYARYWRDKDYLQKLKEAEQAADNQ